MNGPELDATLHTHSENALRAGHSAERRWGRLTLIVAFGLTITAYSNAMRGEFVYDDQFEIVNNPLIQQPQLYLKAITSDVWAFKGDRGQAWSNYWRPMFVTWMAVNYQFFGLNVIGWHVTSLAAHLAVIALLYQVLKQLRIRMAVRAMTVWLFALHPTHVESVAWASGIPNMLMSGFIFASYASYLRWRRGGGGGIAWAVVFYLLSLLSKEGMIVYPAIIFFTEWALARRDSGALRVNWGRALRHAAVFAVVAAVFLAARYQVIGTMRRLPPGAPGLMGSLATAPSVLAFYIQKILWPFPLGMAYPLRAVNNANIGWWNFWLPVTVIAILARLMMALAPRDRAYRIGLVWFFFPIVLALDVRVFLPEELVHDRYLYLAVFGAALILSQGMRDIVRHFSSVSVWRTSIGIAGATAIVLAVLTYQQNPTWANDVAMWRQATTTDPTSSQASAEYGEALRRAGKLDDARVELERSLSLNPGLRTSNLSLGMLAVQEGRVIEGERLLRHVLESLPGDYVALENLAQCLQKQGRISEAVALFDEGRRSMPFKHAEYTVNIAVLEQSRGNSDEAVRVLTSIHEEMTKSAVPSVVRGLFFLGELHREAGRNEAARSEYDAFLIRARTFRSRELAPMVEVAEAALRVLPP